MTKTVKLIITISISIILFLLLDFCSYTADWYAIKKEHDKFDTYLPPFHYSWKLDPDPYSYIISQSTFKKPINTTSEKSPIYIFGCSFAYGEHLQPDETFGAKLAKLSERPLYNFAYPGFSIQHMLFQLEHMQFPKTKAPKYVIYVYMTDHMRRMRTEYMQAYELTRYPLYKPDKNGELKFEKLRNLSPSMIYMVKKFKCFWIKHIAQSPKYEQQNFELIEKHFLKANDLIHKKYPDSEFIILVYNPNDEENKHNWKNLETQNIKVITTTELLPEMDLNDNKYKRIDGHPSAKVWEILTPRFIKYSGIK